MSHHDAVFSRAKPIFITGQVRVESIQQRLVYCRRRSPGVITGGGGESQNCRPTHSAVSVGNYSRAQNAMDPEYGKLKNDMMYTLSHGENSVTQVDSRCKLEKIYSHRSNNSALNPRWGLTICYTGLVRV